MRKRITLILVLLFAMSLFVVDVFAHPGDTDSNGGHVDRSTGEYHYHHGYSAHSHYDIDGDGDIDCPYDFKDKTGQNSGNDSHNSTGVASDISNDYVKRNGLQRFIRDIFDDLGPVYSIICLISFVLLILTIAILFPIACKRHDSDLIILAVLCCIVFGGCSFLISGPLMILFWCVIYPIFRGIRRLFTFFFSRNKNKSTEI